MKLTINKSPRWNLKKHQIKLHCNILIRHNIDKSQSSNVAKHLVRGPVTRLAAVVNCLLVRSDAFRLSSGIYSLCWIRKVFSGNIFLHSGSLSQNSLKDTILLFIESFFVHFSLYSTEYIINCLTMTYRQLMVIILFPFASFELCLINFTELLSIMSLWDKKLWTRLV